MVLDGAERGGIDHFHRHDIGYERHYAQFGFECIELIYRFLIAESLELENRDIQFVCGVYDRIGASAFFSGRSEYADDFVFTFFDEGFQYRFSECRLANDGDFQGFSLRVGVCVTAGRVVLTRTSLSCRVRIDYR